MALSGLILLGGALVVPGSLALIQGSFHPDVRARAVGGWSGLSGVAGAVSNGVARAAGLVVVAALPLLAGLPPDAGQDPVALERGC